MFQLFICLFFTTKIFASSFTINTIIDNEEHSGYGFFIDNKGTALTSYHVIENAESAKAIINEQEYEIQIIGYDEVQDIAAIKVSLEKTQFYAVWENAIGINQHIVIHNAETEYQGVVLQKNHNNNFVTSIDIEEGFSGSPIFCEKKVCGIITSFDLDTKNAIGIDISKIFLNTKSILYGYSYQKKDMKIYATNLTKDHMLFLEMDMKQNIQGILVTYSENQKIKPWDIITHINTTKIENLEDVQKIVQNLYEGENIIVRIIRNKKEQNVAL